MPGRLLLDALTDHLRARHILLILDNCEHVIDTTARTVDTLVRACGQVHVLATSREVLGLAGEATWRVMPLSVVDPRQLDPARLAVFTGGWSLDAAEALGSDLGQGQPDVFELVSKSMVVVDHPADGESEPRYRFLETIRQYAEQKLVESVKAEAVRRCHRDWYMGLAEQAVDGMEGAEQKRWWARSRG